MSKQFYSCFGAFLVPWCFGGIFILNLLEPFKCITTTFYYSHYLESCRTATFYNYINKHQDKC